MKLEIKDRKLYVIDIETLSNCFTYIALNVDTEEIITFVIHSTRNDLNALRIHLIDCRGHITFNGLTFDYPVLHYILTESNITAESIYKKSQEIIDTPEDKKFDVVIPEWKCIIPQLDLYKINHFDNQAKRTSLKDLEFWMQYPNVQDMPIEHTDFITEDQIKDILDYNLNDVKATFEFYKLCLNKIELRKDIGKFYSLQLLNANDPKIGSEIFLDLLSKDMNIEKKDLKKLRTFRKSIALGEIILPYIDFTSNEFKKLLKTLKNSVVVETKNALENSVVYKGFRYDFGLGGLHGCIKPGVYEATEEYIIRDIDVGSFYPNLAINNNFKPQHLGEAFSKIYKEMYVTRAKAKKEGNKVVNEGLKLALNGCFGKMNSMFSYLYDPKALLSITLNGQLLLAMLVEEIVNTIDCEVLQVNTDGISIKYHEQYSDAVDLISEKWCRMTKLELEHNYYKKMVIQDVNNYMAIYTNNKVKYKGLFEIDKEAHKDTSSKIVPIALSEYFKTGRPIEDTIKNHKNIYDFCIRGKFKSDSYGETRFIAVDDAGYPIEVRNKQQKTTRYFISNTGCTFIKVYPEKEKESFINKGFQVTIFNTYYFSDDYDINYNYYIQECNKILDSIENKQLTLF